MFSDQYGIKATLHRTVVCMRSTGRKDHLVWPVAHAQETTPETSPSPAPTPEKRDSRDQALAQ